MTIDNRIGKSSPSANQHARFVETARALGCDEDEATFDEKLKAVVGPKITDEPKPPAPATEEAGSDLPPLSEKRWEEFERSLPRNERDKRPKPKSTN